MKPKAATAATIEALPRTVNLSLYAGDDFTMTLTVRNADQTPADLTGATAEAEIRASAADDDPPLGSFTATIDENVIALNLAGADSAALPAKSVWDCQITTAAGAVSTLAAGSITMAPEVTR